MLLFWECSNQNPMSSCIYIPWHKDIILLEKVLWQMFEQIRWFSIPFVKPLPLYTNNLSASCSTLWSKLQIGLDDIVCQIVVFKLLVVAVQGKKDSSNPHKKTYYQTKKHAYMQENKNLQMLVNWCLFTAELYWWGFIKILKFRNLCFSPL